MALCCPHLKGYKDGWGTITDNAVAITSEILITCGRTCPVVGFIGTIGLDGTTGLFQVTGNNAFNGLHISFVRNLAADGTSIDSPTAITCNSLMVPKTVVSP